MSISGPVNNQSQFLPTTTVLPTDQNELLIRLTTNYTAQSQAINNRVVGIYETSEILNGQQWNNPGQPTNRRQAFRNTYNLILLNNGNNIGAGATVTFPTNISPKFATLIYASCTSTAGDLFTVVYPNAKITGSNLVFTNPLGATALNSVLFIAEYLKS